ncbi:MAG: sortase [Candidatus Campbellbacteria bacterium]|nr:sortase [Candidatus Campbellbacteria bacterium]
MENLLQEKTTRVDVAISFVTLGIVFCLLFSSFVFTISVVNADEEKVRDNSQELAEEEEKALEETEKTAKNNPETTKESRNLKPDRITAPSIGLDAKIKMPNSRDIDVLDSALKDGVVHYPGSGYLGENNANIFLFGHSSFLPVVNNQNYRIFNNIKGLEIGDEIVMESAGKKFIYQVTSNKLAKDHEVRVDFETDEAMLTLATCNSFGAKEDRFIVEAVLIKEVK